DVTYGGTATASLDCASTVWITNSGTQPIPPLNYGNLEVLGGNRVFPNGDTIGICSGFNVNPSLHTYTVTGSTVRYFSSGSGWVMIPFTYNNLHFDGTGDFSLGYSATNANKTYNVLGDFTQTKGIVYIGENGSATATLNVFGNTTISGGTLVVNQETGGTGVLNMRGNLTVNGGILTSNVNTNAFLRFTGTGQQDVSLTGANQIFHTEINKASGFVNLLTDYQTRRTLTMTAGNIVTNTNLFELGENTTNKGTLSYTSGFVNGRMRRWFASTNSNDATGLFPMGQDVSGMKNRFTRVYFTTAPSTGGHLTVEYVTSPMGVAGLPIAAASTGGFGLDVTSTEDQGYWKIDNQAGTLTDGAYTISCTGQGFSTINALSGITLLKRVGGGNWFCPGAHVAATGTTAVPTVSRSGVSGWSNFGFGGNVANPLPVELLSFNAGCAETAVELTWSTGSETNSDQFILERSRDVNVWNSVAVVDAAGNSTSQLDYQHTDENPFPGVSYYRLRQIDFNGNERVYGPISVNCSAQGEGIEVYPNPASQQFTVAIALKDDMPATRIQVLDVSGKIIATQVNDLKAGTTNILFDQLDLPAGTYMIHVVSNASHFAPLRLVITN
ncbi:MAG: T9SS type A sorting domain-containing protein, partial [Crocinitomicaceae bacterium]